MTLTADKKSRIASRELFPPHSSFEALKEPDGRIVLLRLRRDERPAQLVKPVRQKGLWVLPGQLDGEALTAEIQHARESRDAGLLG